MKPIPLFVLLISLASTVFCEEKAPAIQLNMTDLPITYADGTQPLSYLSACLKPRTSTEPLPVIVSYTREAGLRLVVFYLSAIWQQGDRTCYSAVIASKKAQVQKVTVITEASDIPITQD